MARELDDSRQGSPCQRAAAEMLEQGPYGDGMQPEVACLPPTCNEQGFAMSRQQFLAAGPSGQTQWPSGGAFPQSPKQEPWEGGRGAWGTDQRRQAHAWGGQPAQGRQMPLREQYGMAQVPVYGPAHSLPGHLQQGQVGPACGIQEQQWGCGHDGACVAAL